MEAHVTTAFLAAGGARTCMPSIAQFSYIDGGTVGIAASSDGRGLAFMASNGGMRQDTDAGV
jgi:hypothetical protein